MKLLLKLLLSVTLLGVVVGVSYLKTVSENDSEKSVVDENASKMDTAVKENATDDTNEPELTDKKTSVSKPSITPSENIAEKIVKKPKPSAKTKNVPAGSKSSGAEAPKVMALTSQAIPKAEKKTHQEEPTTATPTSSKSGKSKPNASNSDEGVREEQIVLYFRNKLSALPDDLSSYEKKVAFKEVRDETCELFHISRTKLSQLARVHKITYP